jgi:hypothetical protein
MFDIYRNKLLTSQGNYEHIQTQIIRNYLHLFLRLSLWIFIDY